MGFKIGERMTRRESREKAFQIIFGMTFNDNNAEESILFAIEDENSLFDEFSVNLINTVYKYREPIDLKLEPYLRGWSINRISKVSLAILRLSCAQLFYWNEIDIEPVERVEKIVINESVELAKKYGCDDDYSFINGILGSMVRGES